MTTLRITYHSGAQFDVRCTAFRVTYSPDTQRLTALSIDDIQKRSPIPKFFGLDDIESVWELT